MLNIKNIQNIYDRKLSVDENDIDIGRISHYFPNFVLQELMEIHVKHYDILAMLSDTNSSVKEILSAIKIRGFTFSEFKLLFEKSIREKDFHQHVIFIVLSIFTEFDQKIDGKQYVGRQFYLSKYSPNDEGYFSCLLSFYGGILPSFLAFEPLARLSYEDSFSHMILSGKSGTGKSTLLRTLIRQYYDKDCSQIILDPGGIFSENIKNSKYLNNEDIVYFTPKAFQDHTCILNPFERNSRIDLENQLETLTDIFSYVLSENKPSSAMKSILRPCLAILLEKEGTSLSDLKRFFTIGENSDLIKLGLDHPNKEYHNTFKDLSNKKKMSSNQALIDRTNNILQDPILQQSVIGKSTINLYEAIEEGKTIIFNLVNISSDDGVELFGRIVIYLTCNYAMSRDLKRVNEEKRIFLYIDEVQNFLSKRIVKILDEARQKKLHLVMAHQRIGQFSKDTEYSDAAIGNTNVKFIGLNQSPQTIKLYSSTLGISREELANIPKYHFKCRIEGKPDIIFRSLNYVNEENFFLSQKERQKRDNFLKNKFYQEQNFPTKTSKISDFLPKKPLDVEEAAQTKRETYEIDMNDLD